MTNSTARPTAALDRRGRLGATAVAASLLGLTLLAGMPRAAAAGSRGELGLDPATGRTDLGVVALISTAKCPAETTNYLVRISGAGFPENTGYIVGNTDISMAELAPGSEGYLLRLPSDFDDLATQARAPLPLKGTATMTLVCGDLFLKKHFAEMTGQVRFTPDGGSKDKPGEYTQVGGPQVASGRPDLPVPGADGTPQAGAFPPGTHPVGGVAGTAMATAAQNHATQTAVVAKNVPLDTTSPATTTTSDVHPDVAAGSAARASDPAVAPTAAVRSGRTRGAGHTAFYVGGAIVLLLFAAGGAAVARRPREFVDSH